MNLRVRLTVAELWTGETRFFKEGHEFVPIPKSWYVRGAPGVVHTSENEVIAELVRKNEYDHEPMIDSITTVGSNGSCFQRVNGIVRI